MSNITCGNCKGQHESVEQVKACYAGSDRPTAEAATPDTMAATDKQKGLIEKLLAEKDTGGLRVPDLEKIGKRQASTLIEFLLKQPKKAVVPQAAIDAVKEPRTIAVTEGMYRMDGHIYKVQVATESGRLYAKMLQGNSFVYSKGAIFRLVPEHRMTLDEAAAFGKLYGQCCVCGRTLTDEVSIANGIGPVCAGKGWWSQEERDAVAVARVVVDADVDIDDESHDYLKPQFADEWSSLRD